MLVTEWSAVFLKVFIQINANSREKLKETKKISRGLEAAS